jgi:putative membrane protein
MNGWWYHGMNGWWDHGMGGWGYAGMAIGMVLFWTLIVVGIIAVIRFSAGTAQSRAISGYQPYRDSPEQLLAARFARGEIDDEEYRRRILVLREHQK